MLHKGIAKRVAAQEATTRIGKIDTDFAAATEAYIDNASWWRQLIANATLSPGRLNTPGKLLTRSYVMSGDIPDMLMPEDAHSIYAEKLMTEHKGIVDEAIKSALDTQIKDEFSATFQAFRALHESRTLGLPLKKMGIDYGSK